MEPELGISIEFPGDAAGQEQDWNSQVLTLFTLFYYLPELWAFKFLSPA